MATTNIQLNDEEIKAIVARAVLDKMGAEQRDALLQSAIKHLMTPAESRGYGHPKPTSPLQDIFCNAVTAMTREVVVDALRDDGNVKLAITRVVSEALIKATADAEIVSDMASIFGRMFSEAARQR